MEPSKEYVCVWIRMAAVLLKPCIPIIQHFYFCQKSLLLLTFWCHWVLQIFNQLEIIQKCLKNFDNTVLNHLKSTVFFNFLNNSEFRHSRFLKYSDDIKHLSLKKQELCGLNDLNKCVVFLKSLEVCCSSVVRELH